MTTPLIFPQDFNECMHAIVPGASQWTAPTNGKIVISIVGGGYGLYGDGINTFEMYDFRESDVQGHLSTDEINEHLLNNPL